MLYNNDFINLYIDTECSSYTIEDCEFGISLVKIDEEKGNLHSKALNWLKGQFTMHLGIFVPVHIVNDP